MIRLITPCFIRWIPLLFMVFYASPTYSADIGFGNVIPGAGVVHLSVHSMKGMHFIHVVRQEDDFSCGAASLATILKYGFNLPVTEDSVMKGLFHISDPAVVRKIGFSLLDLKNYVDNIGLKGQGYEINIEQLQHVNIPVIVLLNLGGYKHFVVVEKVTAAQVYMADPMLGNRIMGIEEFKKDWNGIVFAIFGKNYDAHNVLLTPPEPPSALRVLRGQLPVLKAPVVHFGFNQASHF